MVRACFLRLGSASSPVGVSKKPLYLFSQTHSGLNMFKTANDVKSNLMLTALSWVDFYRPKYAYMENVTGFLSYRLGTKQATMHRVEGGITMGVLKLVVRALLEMG